MVCGRLRGFPESSLLQQARVHGREHADSSHMCQKKENGSFPPFMSGGWLTQLCFLNSWPVLKFGKEMGGELTSDMLPPIPQRSSPDALAQRLSEKWAVELKKPRPSLTLAILRFYGWHSLMAICGALLGLEHAASQVALPSLDHVAPRSQSGR